MTAKDISCTRLHSGAWQLSAMVDGYLLTRTYYHFTKRHAQSDFIENHTFYSRFYK